MGRHMGGLRWRAAELHSHGSLIYFCRALLGFLWPVIFICLVQSPYFVYLRILPCVHTQLLAKTGSTAEAYG